MIGIIIAILGGMVSASSHIILKELKTKEMIYRLAPYQFLIGSILVFWSLWSIINGVLKIDKFELSWFIVLAIGALEFVIGFLLTFGFISIYLLKKKEAIKEKSQAWHLKLIRQQTSAGLILIAFGLLLLALYLIG